jgi:ABC-type antimicrobial peptide transport system permease subunit
VVNEAAARLLWPGAEALGEAIVAFGDEPWTVVGVATDARYQAFVETRPVAYFPNRQVTTFPPAHLLIRVDGPADDLLPSVRAAMAEADPAIRVMGASSLADRLRAPLARPRFAAVIVGLVALTTLLLGAIGVYGVMAASVRARSREVGVRMACGAAPGSVRSLILRQSAAAASIGCALGAAAVVPGGAWLESLLFGVAPSDPGSLAAGVALVLAAALVASWIPARRAAGLDPVLALRAE